MSTDKNKHLSCVLKSHNIENNEELMSAYRQKRDEVRDDLKKKYEGLIYYVIHSGSYKKKTAVNIKFDMDLIIPFKKDSARTLENLFNDLFEYFDKDYRKKDDTLCNVKKQKVAIGLEFMVDGHFLDLDIVPGREINDYEKDGDLNLFVVEAMGVFAKSTYLKTNIKDQIEHIRDNSSARESVKLMKVWKRRNNGNIKSFIIELICIRALDGYSGDTDLCSKLKFVIAYIRDNIKTARLTDPGNSNNVVSDSLDDFQKTGISDTMKWLLDDMEKNEQAIVRYFPVNPEFPCEDEKRNVYVVSPGKKADRLNNEDFG